MKCIKLIVYFKLNLLFLLFSNILLFNLTLQRLNFYISTHNFNSLNFSLIKFFFEIVFILKKRVLSLK